MLSNTPRSSKLIHVIGKNFVRQVLTTSSMMEVNQNKFALPKRFDAIGKYNVWADYIQLAIKHNPLNLGQGFPDFAPPAYVTKSLEHTALLDPVNHQYTRLLGHPRLVKVLSALYSRLLERPINKHNEILVTFGASEALYLAIAGNVQAGDEVIIVEPFFECFQSMVKMSGGVCKFIPLRLKTSSKDKDGAVSSEDYALDTDELERTFNSRTKVIIFNTPNNPLGKVYSRSEMEIVANLCKKWNVLCIADEVYEWLAYKPNQHIRMATLPGMWERTITIGSAGKIFSVTGWKTGWTIGPSKLLNNLRVVHDSIVSSCNTPMQEAVAISLEKETERLDSEDCYFYSLNRELKEKRDYMTRCLIEAGMKPIVPQGGYFIIADFASWESKIDLSGEPDHFKDFRFTKWLIKNVGLLGLPTSIFYGDEHKEMGENCVRYCFVKDNKYLEDVNEVLQKWKPK